MTRSQGDLEVQLEEYKAKMNGATSELSGERKKSAKQQILQSRLEILSLVQFFKINQNTMKHKNRAPIFSQPQASTQKNLPET